MNNALLYFGGLLVVTFAALFAVPHFVDWNGYRGVFEEEASKVLGRDVRVGGNVNVRFLPTPFVSFEKVRLADPTGQTGEPFVSADSFTMRLSGPALLRGVLEANEIELERPALTLALDNHGGGNWTSVQIKSAALPFVPQNVALHSVKIVNGAVAFFNAEAQQIARAENIDGEFSAEALNGPFKFKGQLKWAGEVRDVKFATTVPDATGAFQIKANTRGLTSDTSYALDATIADLSSKPQMTGALVGKLPLQSKATIEGANADMAVMDLTSRIEATTGGAKISDITLSVENVAEPQLITGTANAVWGMAPRLDVVLASKWLDLDRLAGAGQDSATFLKIKQLGLSVLRGLAGSGEAAAKIDIEQVKLGGETAGAMKINASRRGSTVQLNELKAGLPGGARLDLSGDLKDDDGKVSFQGSGYIRGSNLARLLDWAAKSGANLDIKSEGPFSAEGQVLIGEKRLELTEASAELGGRPFTGDLVVSDDAVRRVAVTLEAASIDSSELFPATAREVETNLRRALGLAPMSRDAASAELGSAKPDADRSGQDGDISVRVLAGELKHGAQVFRNVDATVRLDRGSIRIPSAKFTTPAGLNIAIDARISDAHDKPKGTLAYDFVASSAAAVKDIVAFTGLAPLLPEGHVARVTSAKLAGLVRLGARYAASADVTVDGTVQSARVAGSAEFDGGLQQWSSGLSRTRVTARAPSLAPLLSAFGFVATPTAAESAHEAELVFATAGQIGAGAAATLEITAPGFQSVYDGRFALSDEAPAASVAGTARLKANDAVDVLSVAAIPAPRGLSGVPVEGIVAVSRENGQWTLSTRKLVAGGATFNGTATAKSAADGMTELGANLHADKLTVAGLLSPLHDAQLPNQDVTAQPASATEIWPTGVFNLAAFEFVKGTVRLGFGSLSLQPGIAARSGALEIALAPGSIAITDIKGQAIGGALLGAVALTKAPSGIKFDGTLKIDGADLAHLSAAARGKATLDAKAAAQAQSAAGLLAVLNGSGSLTLDEASVPAPGPSASAAVIASVLANKLPNQPQDVHAALLEAVAASKADLGSRTIPIVITDGVAKLETVNLESPSGKVSTATVVDLTTLAIDSAWKLSAIVPPLPPPSEPLPGWVAPAPKGPLPPATVVYTGALNHLPEVTAALDASDMQRELAVRQLERNVEELERLRRVDEHRAKLEQQRRQTLEADRAAAAAAAAAAKAAGAKPPAAAMPPVLPESSGTAIEPHSSAPPPETPATGEVATDTGAASSSETANPADAAVAPQPPVPVTRPQPVRPRPSQARRTTADEVMRSLGGYP